MSSTTFDELLQGFTDLWTELGNFPFFLVWHSLSGHSRRTQGDIFSGDGQIIGWDGWSKEHPPFDIASREVIGRLALPLDEGGESFTFATDVVTLPRHESCTEACKTFKALSARGGAELPAKVKLELARHVHLLNTDPAAWWYALLFERNGERVFFKDGNVVRTHSEITIYNPLLLSITTIEELGLGTAADAIATWRDDVLSGTKPPRWAVGYGFDCIELGPGQVLLLGGAPGSGKTALAMQWVVDALHINESLRALVANVESSPNVLLDRQLAGLSGIPLSTVRDRALTEMHAERLADAFEILESVADRLTFLTAPFSLPNVAAAADATDSQLIVVDYAQRFAAGENEKRHEVNRLMDYLRRFADAGCGLLVLAAVGRTKDRQGRSCYDPDGLNLASFRESSELEFGADAAYMLRPDGPGKLKLACLKSRLGEPTSVELEFEGSVQRFTQPTAEDVTLPSVKELWGLPAGGDEIG